MIKRILRDVSEIRMTELMFDADKDGNNTLTLSEFVYLILFSSRF